MNKNFRWAAIPPRVFALAVLAFWTPSILGAVPPNLTSVTPVSQTQINLAWTYTGLNPSNFGIYTLCPNTSTICTKVATVFGSTRSYSNVGLPANTTYCYQILPNSIGPASNIACATT